MSLTVTAFAGSLREKSFNKRILNHLKEMYSEEIEVLPIDELPLFNADLEDGGDPKEVKKWKDAIKKADGLLIVTPEYSHGMPGVMKNALDWAGSESNENVLNKKPVMIVGATPSAMGTGFSQAQLRQSLASCGSYVLPQPQVFIAQVHKKMDQSGKLHDEQTSSFLHHAFSTFRSWVQKINRAGEE